jgi:hypothetical protein
MIWYVSVPDRLTSPTLPGLVISPGMMPTFDLPGEISPGQFGPMSTGRPSIVNVPSGRRGYSVL